jgi:hypothetical protein
MTFRPGESGNVRGRPKGSCGGRARALAVLDKMLGKKRSETALLRALEEEFEKDPVRFFKTIVMPLLPKESKLKLDQDGVIEWRSLLDTDDEQCGV